MFVCFQMMGANQHAVLLLSPVMCRKQTVSFACWIYKNTFTRVHCIFFLNLLINVSV